MPGVGVVMYTLFMLRPLAKVCYPSEGFAFSHWSKAMTPLAVICPYQQYTFILHVSHTGLPLLPILGNT